MGTNTTETYDPERAVALSLEAERHANRAAGLGRAVLQKEAGPLAARYAAETQLYARAARAALSSANEALAEAKLPASALCHARICGRVEAAARVADRAAADAATAFQLWQLAIERGL